MLKIVTTINNRRTAIFAFDRTNLDRLMADQPVFVDIQALRQHADYDDPIQDIVIMADETLKGCADKLRAVGLPVPDYAEPGPNDPSIVKP